MIRKTFKTTIPGFNFNEEMADKEKNSLLISLSKYEREKLKNEQRTQEPKTGTKSYSIFTEQGTLQILHVRNYHKMHFLLN